MLLFDFINPWITYLFVLGSFVFVFWAIFHRQDFIRKHKKTIISIAMVLLIWTQFARYAGVFFEEDTTWSFLIFNFKVKAFSWGTHLPFYVCRLSVVVLLYYTITKDKKVEPFLFFWGATGLAGVLYPNSNDIYNIYNLTETFFIDHFLLAVTPFFLVVYQGYRPSLKDAVKISLVMFAILTIFIPLNNIITDIINIDGYQVDYFYVIDQSIVGVLSEQLFGKKLPSIVFVLIHSITALGFFSIYYQVFRNKNYKI
jgi:uncharacterized membrane protein YwaF